MLEEIRLEYRLRQVVKVLFVLYFAVLLKLTVFKLVPITNLDAAFYMTGREINYIPFRAISEIFRGLINHTTIVNLLGNLIVFIPFGWLMPLTTTAERETIVYGFTISALIELVQFIFAMGVADIDDLILNTLGTIIGYFIYRGVVRVIRKQNGILGLFLFITAVGTALAILMMYLDGTLI